MIDVVLVLLAAVIAGLSIVVAVVAALRLLAGERHLALETLMIAGAGIAVAIFLLWRML